jgi:hypothetical protein
LITLGDVFPASPKVNSSYFSDSGASLTRWRAARQLTPGN